MTKTVLITGASQGIGAATARLFASHGYDLVLAARTATNLEAIASELSGPGRKVLAIPTDMGDFNQVQELVNQAVNQFYHIDVLINNAGMCMNAPMAKTTIEDWQNIINVNLWGYIYTINLLLPHFLNRQQGTIVNVGSIGGLLPLPKMTAYSTTKHAITGLTNTLRLELEPQGIHVCGVYPSATDSDFLERAVFKGDETTDAESQREQLAKMLKSPIASKSEDVAKAIYSVVEKPQAEVVVGSGAFVTSLYRLFPGVTNWMMGRSVKV